MPDVGCRAEVGTRQRRGQAGSPGPSSSFQSNCSMNLLSCSILLHAWLGGRQSQPSYWVYNDRRSAVQTLLGNTPHLLRNLGNTPHLLRNLTRHLPAMLRAVAGIRAPLCAAISSSRTLISNQQDSAHAHCTARLLYCFGFIKRNSLKKLFRIVI